VVTAEPSFTVKTIDYVHQTGPTETNWKVRYTTDTLNVQSVMVSVAASKWELFFNKSGMKTNTVLVGYLVISTNVRCYYACHWQQFCCSPSETVHWCKLHSKQSNRYSAKFPTSFYLSSSPIMVQRLTSLTRFRESYSSSSISCH